MGNSCLRYSQKHRCVARRQEHGRRQCQHSDSRQEPGGILGPAAGCMVLSEKPETVCDQPCYDNEIRDCGNPVLQIHP